MDEAQDRRRTDRAKVKTLTLPENDTHPKIPAELAVLLRKLAHDLSNSIETILQASYLLSQSNLDEPNKKWMSLIESATGDAARINREIRDILRTHS